MKLDVFAEMIIDKRNSLGLSIDEVSEKTGIVIDVLEKYEAGIQKPTAQDIKSLGKVLGIPPVILMHGPGTVHYSDIDDDGHKTSKWKKF